MHVCVVPLWKGLEGFHCSISIYALRMHAHVLLDAIILKAFCVSLFSERFRICIPVHVYIRYV